MTAEQINAHRPDDQEMKEALITVLGSNVNGLDAYTASQAIGEVIDIADVSLMKIMRLLQSLESDGLVEQVDVHSETGATRPHVPKPQPFGHGMLSMPLNFDLPQASQPVAKWITHYRKKVAEAPLFEYKVLPKSTE